MCAALGTPLRQLGGFCPANAPADTASHRTPGRRAEWLCGERPAEQHAFRVDVAAGHRAWAAHCMKLLEGRRDLGAVLDGYSLRYVLQHALAAGDAGAGPHGRSCSLRMPASGAWAALPRQAAPSALQGRLPRCCWTLTTGSTSSPLARWSLRCWRMWRR